MEAVDVGSMAGGAFIVGALVRAFAAAGNLTEDRGRRWLPLVSISLGIGWGLLVAFSGGFDGDLLTGAFSGVLTAATASGGQSWLTTAARARGGTEPQQGGS